MKRFAIREVETLKTTAAMYSPCTECCCGIEVCYDELGAWCCSG